MTTSKKWNKRGSRALAASLSIALVAANFALAGPVAHAAVADNDGSNKFSLRRSTGASPKTAAML